VINFRTTVGMLKLLQRKGCMFSFLYFIFVYFIFVHYFMFGVYYRSDRLWESYIKWETEGKRLQNVTNLYDRLLATPTQGYTNHFDK